MLPLVSVSANLGLGFVLQNPYKEEIAWSRGGGGLWKIECIMHLDTGAKVSKNLGVTSKALAPNGLLKASSILKTHRRHSTKCIRPDDKTLMICAPLQL